MFNSINNNDLNKLERKFGHLAIPNLMQIIVIGMVAVYVLDMFSMPVSRGAGISQLIAFSRSAILRGQIWRVITFVFMPPATRPIFLLVTLYFFWMIGQSLELNWGSFRFTLYYLIGVIGTIIGGFITGHASNYYLNLSLFIAFAIFNPEMEVLLFFILPVKIKYLAYFSAASLLYMFIISGWAGKVSILVSLLNLFLFFGEDFIDSIRGLIRRIKWKMDTRQ